MLARQPRASLLPSAAILAGVAFTLATGFAAEHIAYSPTAPHLGNAPPVQLQALGAPNPTPFELTGGQSIQIPGTSAAFRYVATRPDGFAATVINAYDYSAAVELWLMIDSPPAVTQTIVSSLRA